jgi:hypothetical protein
VAACEENADEPPFVLESIFDGRALVEATPVD